MKLVLATEAQKRERDRLNFPEWGTRLTLEQYLEREQRLRAHAWSREALRSFLWLGERGEALSSCEAYRMRSHLRSGGSIHSGWTYAIASVFTEPALRGKGHGARMMGALIEQLRSETSSHATILFSDVGASLYQRGGYVERPCADWVLEPIKGDPAGEVDGLAHESEVSSVLEMIGSPVDDFAVLPSTAQIDWHLERARIYAQLLARDRPFTCGARAGSSAALWAASFKQNELYVLTLRGRSVGESIALMRAAQCAAGSAGLTAVRCWQQPLDFEWPASLGARVETRDGGLPMICPLNRDVSPASWKTIPRALWV